MFKNGENKIRIVENKEKDRLDIARFSVSYNVPQDVDSATKLAHKTLQKLGGGNDAIMEYNSGFTSVGNKYEVSIMSAQEYSEEFKKHGIEYKYRKVPSTKTSILENLFSIKQSKKEDDEILSYIKNDFFAAEDFRRLIPFYGVRFYFGKREKLISENETGYDAVSRFAGLMDHEKLNLIEMAVFIYASFGQIGISTLKVGAARLKEILEPK